MTDDSKVTVRVDETGAIVGLDIDGEIDRDNLTEERPSKPPPALNTDEFVNHQAVRWFG